MNWNHRVWVQKIGEESFYSVRETYYNSKGQVTACSAKPERIGSDSLEGLAKTLERMQSAVYVVQHGLGHVVLEFDEFEYAPWDTDEEN